MIATKLMTTIGVEKMKGKALIGAAIAAALLAGQTLTGFAGRAGVAQPQKVWSAPNQHYVALNASRAQLAAPLTPCTAPPPQVNAKPILVAKTGQAVGDSTIQEIRNGISINNKGDVAFVSGTDRGDAIMVGSNVTDTRKINPAFESYSRLFGETVQIRDDRYVAARDVLAGAPPSTFIRLWNAEPGFENTYTLVDNATGSRAVLEPVSTNNTGGIVYPVIDNANIRTLKFGEEGEVGINWTAARPALAPNGKAAVRGGSTLASPIKLLSSGFFGDETIAGADDFLETGQQPAAGASNAVAFYGYLAFSSPLKQQAGIRTYGAGIFVSYELDGERTLYRVAGEACNGELDPGEAHVDLNGDGKLDPLEDQGFIRDFAKDARVAINLTDSPASLQVGFVATDTLGIAVYVSRIPKTDTGLDIKGQDLRRIVGYGDSIPGMSGAVVDVAISDRISANGSLAVWVRTDANEQGVLRIVRDMKRPLLIVPGIGGTGPRANDFQWWVQRGVHIDHMAVDPLLGVYDDLIQTLINFGYEMNRDLFLVNYDWRVPPTYFDGNIDGVVEGFNADQVSDDTFERGVDYFGYEAKKAALAWREAHPDGPDLDAVDVIAHSTGGLVTRAYIQSDAYNGMLSSVNPTMRLPKVGKFIMVGVPNFGSPKAWNPLWNNWKDDPAFVLVLSKFLMGEMKYLEANPSNAIIGPPSDILSSTLDQDPNLTRAQEFIMQYVPTIDSLLATYPFIRRSPTSALMSPADDPRWAPFVNYVALDLNQGQLVPAHGVGLEAKITGRLTGIVGTYKDSPLIVEEQTGPTFTCKHLADNDPFLLGADISAFDSYAGRCANDGESWYKTLTSSDQSVPYMEFEKGGDGTVPYGSSAGLLYREKEAGGAVDVYEFPGVGHLPLMYDYWTQRAMLLALGYDATQLPESAISTNRHKMDLWAIYEAYFNGILDPRNPANTGMSPAERTAQAAAKAYLYQSISNLDFYASLFDPVQGYAVDAQGRKLGYTTSGGVKTEIPGSYWVGDGAGSGIGFVIAPTASLTLSYSLTGVGAPYLVQSVLYRGKGVTGTESSGVLAAGQQVTASVALPPLQAHERITPTIGWLSPSAGITVPIYGNVQVRVNTTDTSGIERVTVYFDLDSSPELTGTGEIAQAAFTGNDVYSTTIEDVRGVPGPRVLAVVATDNEGNATVLTRTLQVVAPVGLPPTPKPTATARPTITPSPTPSPTPTATPIPTPTPRPGCIGDFTGAGNQPDGHIRVDDVQTIAFRWDATTGNPRYEARFDLNNNARIDTLDVQTVASRWNTTCSNWPSRASENAAASAPQLVHVQMPSGPLQAGVPISAEVWVSDVHDLGGFEVVLQFPVGQFDVSGVALAGFAGSTGRTVTLLPTSVDTPTGRVSFAAFSLGDTPAGPSGSGMLARVALTPLQSSGPLTADVADATLTDTRGERILLPMLPRLYLPLATR
jgi:hypothetical protein